MCARSLRERGVEIFGTGDDDFRAAVADEVHGGLDFGAHASGGEVPLGEIAFHFGDGDVVQRALHRGSIVERDAFNARGDGEHVRAELRRQQGRGEILVYDRVHPEEPFGHTDHRDAPTAYGDDVYGEKVSASCSETGIDITHALRVKGGTTSTYLFISGPDGDMAMALSDMAICDQITPGYLSSNLTVLQNAQVIVCDTNVPQESLIFLAENAKVPLFCDPVSTAKAEKLLPILSKIHTLKPNKLEAELLSGVPIHDHNDVEAAAKALLDKGVHRVFISMGADGMYAATAEEQLWLPNLPGRMVNTTGCGDAAMAALVWAYLEGTDLRGSALAGLAAGSIAMESRQTINPAMSATALRNRMALA